MVAAEQLCWPRLHVPGALALVTGTRASAASRGRGGGACSASVLLRGRRRRGGVFLTCWLSRLSSNWDVAFRVSSRWPRRHFPPLAVPVPRKGAARVDGGGPGASGVSAHGGREARGTGGRSRSAEPSAGQGGRSAVPQCSSPPRPPFSAGLPTACTSWGCSSSTGGWAHAEFPTRGPAWAEFPVMPPLLVPPRPGNPGWAVACLTGGLPRPHGHTRGPFSSPSQNLDDENSTKGR